MAGVHIFKGAYHFYSTTFDTTYDISESDTITVLNNTTFIIPHHAFGRITTGIDTFIYLQQIDDTLVFRSEFWDEHYTYDEEIDTVKYNFNASIIYLNQKYHSKYGSWTKHLHCP